MEIELLQPDPALRDSFLAGLAELESARDRAAWVYLDDEDLPHVDFEAYVKTLLERRRHPPDGLVPDTVLWAVSANEVVGRISLRHDLNESLRTVGGHIGFIVRPSARGRGVATAMLRQLLETEEARTIGRLLLTCDPENEASQKVIARNGGVLDRIVEADGGRIKKKHFWIELN